MEIFSCFILGYTLFNLIYYKSVRQILLMQTVMTSFVCSFINVGYFIDSDIISIDYYQAVLIIQAIVSFICICQGRRKIRISKKLFFYITSLSISLVMLILFPSKTALVTGASGYFEDFMVGRKALMHPVFTKFAVFYFCLAIVLAIDVSVIIYEFDINMWIELICKEAMLSKLLMIIVFFEFIIKDIFRSELYARIITFIFGIGTSTFKKLRIRGFAIALQGLSREGSHMAYGFMLIIMFLFVEYKTTKKKNMPWIVLAIGEMIFTGTLTSVWCGVFLCVFYYIYSTNLESAKSWYGKKESFKHSFLVIFLLLVVASAVFLLVFLENGYIMNRLNELTQVLREIKNYNVQYFTRNYLITSNQSRIFSITSTFSQWFSRPLFGLGLGTTYCYSDTMLTFVETGLIGLWTYYSFYFDFRRDSCKKRPYKAFARAWITCNIFVIYHTRLIVAGDIVLVLGILKIMFLDTKESSICVS